MEKIWVLTKKYSDNSGFYVVRAFRTKERADEDLALVSEDNCMTWELHEVPCPDGETLEEA